jgi:hypothetical protein
MNSANPWSKIYDRIGKAAALEMLAEEAAELSQVALKCARIVRGENPTRADWDMGYRWLVEEIADVSNALDVVDEGLSNEETGPITEAINDWMTTKMNRWYKHLFGEEMPEDE